jgi:tRNA-dihydrouridine synthase
MNFWQDLRKPFFILAPMDGVTDTVFRQIVISVGRPDVVFTEFVSIDALTSKGKDRALDRLKFEQRERPIVAQIWGSDPVKFYHVAGLLSRMGFDGIDINMGCPVRSALIKSSCSALIKNPKRAREIILATIDGGGGLPVSVKTRIGFSEIDTENWVRALLQTPIAALTLHLRTVAEMSKVPPHWTEIEKAVKVRNELKSKALIIGNGDVKSLNEAQEKCRKYKIDGVMIGRGIFENIWLFNSTIDIKNIAPKQKIKLLIKHLNLFQKNYGNNKHFEIMKKFVKCYINNFKDATEAREILMQTKTLDELICILNTNPIYLM